MPDPKNILEITVEYDGEEHVLRTYPYEYRNLMILIFDKLFPDEFGECLGMGKCATCLVEIIEGKEVISSYDRNEAITLSREGVSNQNIRLSCQIIADEHIHGLKVKVI